MFASYPGLVEISARNVTEEALQVLGATNRSELREIDFYILNTTDETLEVLFRRCPNLLSLKIFIGDEGGSDAAVNSIVNHCPRLEQLTLDEWTSLTDQSLVSLSSLSNLKELYMCNSSRVTSLGLQSLIKAHPNFEGLGFATDITNIADVFAYIGSYCPRLRMVQCQPRVPSHAAVVSLVQGCPLLEEFCSEDYYPSDRVLAVMAESCPRMRLLEFDLGGQAEPVTDIGLLALSRGCPDLTQLSLHNTPSITDTAILSIAEHCHKLRSINIVHNHFITTHSVKTLIRANPHITSLSLIQCPLIGDEIVPALASHCPKLRCLTIIDCKRLAEEGLLSMLSFRHSLGFLSIANSDITDALVILIARYCRHLMHITLRDCPEITGHSASSLVKHGKCLTMIDITKCGLEEYDDMSYYYDYNYTTVTATTDQTAKEVEELSLDFYRKPKEKWGYRARRKRRDDDDSYHHWW